MPAPSASDAAGPMIQYDSVVVVNDKANSVAGNGSAVHATSVTRGACRSATSHVSAASSSAYTRKRTVETLAMTARPAARSAGASET